MTVYLVGAGPGDPGLITVRGAELLRSADVVVYDRLAGAPLLRMARPGAELIDVGKTPGVPAAQEDINRLLVRLGGEGRRVVRLKGGDPFVFGRGGEEAEALLAAGIAFEVVPGVTSAVAAPAYAGVPVTHRGRSAAFTVVTGHAGGDVDWEAVGRLGGTVVLLMAVAQRADIARRLVEAGRDPATPVAAVTWGTHAAQVTVRTDLAGLGNATVESPAVIVVGAVADLDLAWFRPGPLAGRRVLLTRPTGAPHTAAAALAEAGARVEEVPATELVDEPGWRDRLASAVGRVAEYSWLVFTSSAAVGRFSSVAPRVAGPRVAAVGPATAAALADAGVAVDLVPDHHDGAALAATIPTAPEGGKVLLPRAAGADPGLVRDLQAKGWSVDEVLLYRSQPVDPDEDGRRRAASCDTVVFFAGSAVRAWARTGAPLPPTVVVVGPRTADAVRAQGWSVAAVAERATPEAVVAAVAAAAPA